MVRIFHMAAVAAVAAALAMPAPSQAASTERDEGAHLDQGHPGALPEGVEPTAPAPRILGQIPGCNPVTVESSGQPVSDEESNLPASTEGGIACAPQTAAVPMPAQPTMAQRRLYNVYFQSGSAELTGPQMSQLDIFLYNNVQRSSNAPIRLVGYADPRGDSQQNRMLSQRRAEAVAAYLASKGIPRERLSIEAVGATPANANGGDFARARRVDIIAQ